MALAVSKLEQNRKHGVRVEGLSESDLVDPALCEELRKLWIEHGLVLFKADVTPSFHVALSRVFGSLECHPVAEYRAKGNPELLSVLFDPEKTDLWEVDGELLGAWLPWHSDLCYMHWINHGGILRVGTLPGVGGDTAFIDKIDAYERLSPGMKERIEGLSVVYRMRIDPREQPYVSLLNDIRLVRTHPRIEDVRERQDRDYPPVVHPLVYTQRETGRKVLNLSPSMAESIYGMEKDESHELLSFLTRHITDERFTYIHKWASDDMLLWDNWRMIHSACGVPPHEHREMLRTTISGDYQLGMTLAEFERRQSAGHA